MEGLQLRPGTGLMVTQGWRCSLQKEPGECLFLALLPSAALWCSGLDAALQEFPKTQLVPEASVSLLLALFPIPTSVFGEGEEGPALPPSILPLWLRAESVACLYQSVKNTSVQERSCPSGRPKEILSPRLISRKKKHALTKKKKKN